MSKVPHAWLAAALLTACGAHATSPRLELDVRLDPEERTLRVEATLHAARLDAFALYEGLTVTAVQLDGEPIVARPGRIERGVREWRLARSGQRMRVMVEGTLAPLDRYADHRRVLHALPPMAAREGSFLPAGGAWYPSPGPGFTYRVRLSLPAGQRGLVAGDLGGEHIATAAGARTVATFEMRAPTDGIDLMAGPYVVAERIVERTAGEHLRLRSYFTPAIEALAEAYLEDSQRYIERYSKSIGAYPFASFSVVASPLPTGFGMPTLAYIGEAVLRLPFIRATSLGHEVLHNWWGNGVRVDYSGGNWAEGLTTFMADYAYREETSELAAREMRLGWLRDFAALPPGEARPLTAFRSRAHGADATTGYGKAAMVFVMLRDLIGEAAFGDGVRRFWVKHRFRDASWSDLRAAFEAASGRDLSIFFAQWLERSGAAAPRVVAARRDGARVELEIEQPAPPYALRVPLEFDAPAESATRFADVSTSSETVRVNGIGSATSVRLDPDVRLWRALDPKTLPPILREWILAAAPRYAVASDALRDAAESFTQRFFENAAHRVELSDAGDAPLLVVGTHADIDAALARLELPPRPSEVAGRGTAQVWTIPRPRDKASIAVISVRDSVSLAALERSLPHYGSQSWLAFEGRRSVARGQWPIRSEVVPVIR